VRNLYRSAFGLVSLLAHAMGSGTVFADPINAVTLPVPLIGAYGLSGPGPLGCPPRVAHIILGVRRLRAKPEKIFVDVQAANPSS
jgi:hypothetical protein